MHVTSQPHCSSCMANSPAGKQAGWQAGKRAGRQTSRQANGQAGKRAGRQTSRQANEQAGKRAGRQTSRQANEQAGKRAGKQAIEERVLRGLEKVGRPELAGKPCFSQHTPYHHALPLTTQCLSPRFAPAGADREAQEAAALAELRVLLPGVDACLHLIGPNIPAH
ncbi:unnamed protein product, partial [Closterium sp. NIES-53]